jgi:hypothetical protein
MRCQGSPPHPVSRRRQASTADLSRLGLSTVPWRSPEPLFFGTDKPNGPVTDEEFRAFLDNQITPRFPDGLTVVKGDGQFMASTGDLVREASFLLILLDPIESANVSNRRIESIRQCYLLQFQQESVLRADQPFASWVYF